MIIGIRDRFGDQTGFRQRPTDSFVGVAPYGTGVVSGGATGDMLRACFNTATGSWALESGGTCGGVTTNGQGNNQGPGGGEFYYQDEYFNNSAGTNVIHDDLAFGSFTQVPGRSEVIYTTMKPVTGRGNTASGGLSWASNETGQQLHTMTLYETRPPASSEFPKNENTFGKANGLGSVAFMSAPAPIELGNRVWFDANGNGIQDPGESGFADVVVGLYDGSGVLVATVTTDANGNYRFSSDTRLTTVDPGLTVVAGLDPRGDYTLAVLASNFNPGGPLAGRSSTLANEEGDTSNDAIDDVRDSDGVAVSVGTGANEATIGVAFTNQGPGSNNHGFDFGFIEGSPPSAVVMGDISLGTASVDGFLNAVGAAGLDRDGLLSLLRVWDPAAAQALAGADRAGLLGALADYLDPDGDGRVALLRWDTLEERGTVGFYVERRVPGSSWVRINATLHPAMVAAPMGAEYILADPGALSDIEYEYRLIELEARGTTLEYGPFRLQVGD
jgi:hypothetical protein